MSNKSIRILRSLSFDPWYNLALEEFLLKQIQPNQIIFYLWQNANTVVIGKNQNPWRECRCREFEAQGGKLARRLSGGGAVFHDLGNLNFTFIMNKDSYDQEKQLSVILQAVNHLGIPAKFSGRNDLVVNEKKFSGNAFYFEENRAYHHGTLLINSDFKKMIHYLKPSEAKIQSKGIDSIQSRVVNLQTLQKNISIETMITALRESFMEHYGKDIHELSITENKNALGKLYEKYASWQWRYGRSPSFDITLHNHFYWGEIEIGWEFKDGHIFSSTIYSDAMNSILIEKISSIFIGLPFQSNALLTALGNISYVEQEDKHMITDIQKWLSKELQSL